MRLDPEQQGEGRSGPDMKQQGEGAGPGVAGSCGGAVGGGGKWGQPRSSRAGSKAEPEAVEWGEQGQAQSGGGRGAAPGAAVGGGEWGWIRNGRRSGPGPRAPGGVGLD